MFNTYSKMAYYSFDIFNFVEMLCFILYDSVNNTFFLLYINLLKIYYLCITLYHTGQ